MSLSVNELNYLIWRYLQEGGLEVSAYALQDETKVDEYDDRYSERVPIGCLVDLVQKGILYSKVNEMVKDDKELATQDIINMDFNLFSAIQEDDKIQMNEERTIKKIEEVDSENKKITEGLSENGEEQQQGKQKQADDDNSKMDVDSEKNDQVESVDKSEDDNFTVVLKEYYSFPPSLANSWNPSHPDVLSWGQRDSYAGICALITNEETGKLDTELKLLPHPVTSKDTIAISWCPKGHSLVTASENGELRMWDANGTIRFIMALHHAPVLTIRWSPNSSHLLTLDVTNKAILWDSNTGQPIQHIDNSSPTINENKCNGSDACWFDNSKFVIPGPKNTLMVYELEDSSQQLLGTLTGHIGLISSIIYNKELKLLCSSSDDQTIRVWKGNSTNSLQVLIGHTQPITYLNWCKISSKEEWFIISCSLDGSIRLWDFIRNKTLDIEVIEDGSPILTASLSPIGNKLAVGDLQGNITIWEVIDVAAENSEPGSIRLKRVSEYQPQLIDASNNFISSIQWNMDGGKIAVSYSGLKSFVIKV